MSVVMTICGTRGCVGHYVSDLLTRAFASFRILLVGSNDASGSKIVYSRCTQGSSHFGTFRHAGRKIKDAERFKVGRTRKVCALRMSPSS